MATTIDFVGALNEKTTCLENPHVVRAMPESRWIECRRRQPPRATMAARGGGGRAPMGKIARIVCDGTHLRASRLASSVTSRDST